MFGKSSELVFFSMIYELSLTYGLTHQQGQALRKKAGGSLIW